MSNNEKVCFDRVLPSEMTSPHVGRLIQLAIGQTRAAFQIAKLWPNGTTLKIRFLGGTAAQQAIVKQFAPQWALVANLKLVFDNAPDAQIRIAFNADDGAWSYIGTDALGIPRDQPTMNLGWQDEGVVLHEFGHAIGMIHEHQNPIANPIQWNKPVVNAALSGSPNFWDQATIQHNMYDKYELSQINGSNFDQKSVMLYSFPASWTLTGFHSDPNEKLSDVDRAFAHGVYPGAGTVDPAVVELPVLTSGTPASIGQPGEEDLFKFTAAGPGHYVVETDGPTDLVMSLYGPNSSTTLVGQDDDSGAGRNPRIAADLVPGSYLVQVRHYNAAGGTGQYTIRVSRQ
ncbi:MAG TPA: M12 family metallopeptidase [Thermoanaerobaculia bacterium]|nr:M12 family metallopeptidase [Thermoanaerobaculia bacterium]